MTNRFNGEAYIPMRDDVRLTGQLLRVWACMRDGVHRSLADIARLTGDPAPSISAQLRHLRKPRFGGHTVSKQYQGNGLYTYHVAPNNAHLVR